MGPLAGALALALARSGCGASAPATAGSTRTSVPAYVTAPFSHEQKLVAQGAHLVVSDGCSACHLDSSAPGIAPDFLSFAGHRVKLSDGRSVLVDERFVRAGLLDPTANEISGYDPAPMLHAVARLNLDEHPEQVAELAAFIEEIGPEPEPG